MTRELDLGEQLTIGNVHECHLDWRDIVGGSGGVLVNAVRLTNVDTAGLQLLLVLKRTLAQTSRSLEWRNPSSELIEVARLTGLDVELELTDG